MTKKAKPRDVVNYVPQPIQPKPKEKEKFLLIPLFALNGMIDDPNGLAKVMQIGSYFTLDRYLNSPDGYEEIFDYKQLIYDCYQIIINHFSPRIIYSNEFHEYIISAVKKYIESNTMFYRYGEEDRKKLINDFLISEINPYDELKVCFWYKMKEFFPNDCHPWKTHREVFEYCKERNQDISKKNIFCLVNLKIMQNILLNHESYVGDDAKQREYRARIAMYLACASIVGNSTFKATTSDLIKCRMFGALNNDELQELLANDESLCMTFDFFTTRRRYDKLLSDLQLSKLVGECPWKRRTFISLRIPDSEKLQRMVINKGKERQRKDLNERKAAVRAAAKTQTMV